jgi:hypothetical protein
MLMATGALFVAGVALFLWDFFFLAGHPVGTGKEEPVRTAAASTV